MSGCGRKWLPTSSGSLDPFLLGPAPRRLEGVSPKLPISVFVCSVLTAGPFLGGGRMSTEVCTENAAGKATEGTARHFLFKAPTPLFSHRPSQQGVIWRLPLSSKRDSTVSSSTQWGEEGGRPLNTNWKGKQPRRRWWMEGWSLSVQSCRMSL